MASLKKRRRSKSGSPNLKSHAVCASLCSFPACAAKCRGEAPGSTGVQFTITREVAAIVPSGGSHLSFRAPDRTAVRAFHSAALAAGGRDDGGPGLRPYHAHYYGAFILDPDGHRIEAVCHAPDRPATEG